MIFRLGRSEKYQCLLEIFKSNFLSGRLLTAKFTHTKKEVSSKCSSNGFTPVKARKAQEELGG